MDESLLFIGKLSSWESLLFLLVFYASASLWIFALFDAKRSTFHKDGEKLIWEQVIIALPLIGALVYLAAGRNRKIP